MPGPTIDSIQFQSTLPVWGGTRTEVRQKSTVLHFNPPSPCGEGHSIPDTHSTGRRFQSTLPVWGGTVPSSLIEQYI